jgi:hypothetical protein
MGSFRSGVRNLAVTIFVFQSRNAKGSADGALMTNDDTETTAE